MSYATITFYAFLFLLLFFSVAAIFVKSSLISIYASFFSFLFLLMAVVVLGLKFLPLFVLISEILFLIVMIKFYFYYTKNIGKIDDKIKPSSKIIIGSLACLVCIIMTSFLFIIIKMEGRDINIQESVLSNYSPEAIYSDNLFFLSLVVIAMFLSIIGISSVLKIRLKKND